MKIRELRNHSSVSKALTLAIICAMMSMLPAAAAQAALEVSFTADENTLAVGETGSWQVTITNPDEEAVTGASLTVTIPDDFTVTDTGGGSESAGPPHTLTWSGLSIDAAGGTAVLGWSARPRCNATNLQQMDALASPGEITATSSAVAVTTPLITITLTDSLGNASTDAHLDDAISWVLTVQNNGTGAAVNGVDITFTLGEHIGFSAIASSTGHTVPGSLTPGVPATWNSGPVAAGASALFEIDGTVEDCDPVKLVNEVMANWGDGADHCLAQDRLANASVALEIREPFLDITVTTPGPMNYCASSTVNVLVDNSAGAGPAVDPVIVLDGLPASWEITNPTGGVTWDDGTATFTLPDIPAGDSLDFDFDIGPSGDTCPAALSASLVFSPNYFDECGALGSEFLFPVVGPESVSIDGSTVPSVSVTKTGPRSAGRGEAGLAYTVTVSYDAPAGNPDLTLDMRDDYPDSTETGLNTGFVVTDTDGGTDDGGVIAWDDVTLSPGDTWTRTIVMTAPTDVCANGHDYANTFTVLGSATDCRGCPIDIPSANQMTFINQGDYPEIITASSKSVDYQDAAGGQVCREVYYTACFTFSAGVESPPGWDGITFSDEVAGDQTFVDVTAVTVNGGTIDSSCYAVSTAGGTLAIDLSGLDDGGACSAPAPSSGAALCVEYTLQAEETSVGSFIDWSSLELPPGYGTQCGGDESYYQGVLVSITRSGLSLDLVSPPLVETCDVTQHRIDLGGSWTAYDTVITLNTTGNYTVLLADGSFPVQFSNVVDGTGAPVAAFDPTDNGDGTYTWDLGDIGTQGSISFYARHACDRPGNWSVSGAYNDLCYDDSGSTHFNTADSETPVVVKRGLVFLYQVPEQFTAYTRLPAVTLFVVNGGSGSVHDVDLALDFDLDLAYYTHAIPDGSDTPTVTGDPGDHQVVFHYDEMTPGKVNKIVLTAQLLGCSDLDIDSTLTWGCDGTVCDELVESSSVNLSSSDLAVLEHSAVAVDYCGGNAAVTINMRNSGQTDVYHVSIVELLPPGLTYVGNESMSHTGGHGALTGGPSISTTMVGSRQQITWDFGNVLPLNDDGDPAMAPGSEIELVFDVELVDCTAAGEYAASDQRAAATATYDRPCNFQDGGSISSSSPKPLPAIPLEPNVRVVKTGRNMTQGTPATSGEVDADTGDVIEWEVTCTSNGDGTAYDVLIADSLPANVSLVGGSFSSTCGSCGSGDYFAAGCDLGDMAQGESCSVTYRTTVDDCTTPVTNEATATFGCCFAEPMLQTNSDSVSLRTRPDYAGGQVTVNTTDWTTCGGAVEVLLTNSGGSAATDAIAVTLPAGYEFDPTGSCSISAAGTPPGLSHAASSCSGASGNSWTWNASNIDFVAPGETVTITFAARMDGATWCDTANDNNESDPDVAVPSDTVELAYDYFDSCGSAFSSSGSATVDPGEPDLDIAVTPAQQTHALGGTAQWTVTVVNDGSVTATNNRLLVTAGDGFSGVEYDSGSGWTECSGGSCTVSLADLDAGNDLTVNLRATVGTGSLDLQLRAEGMCRDQGSGDICTHSWDEAAAYVSAFEITKSVDPATVNVGDNHSWTVRAEFLNGNWYRGVTLTDDLPAHVTYESAAAAAGNDDPPFGSAPSVSGDHVSGQTLTWSPADFQGPATFEWTVTSRVDNHLDVGTGDTMTNEFTADFGIDYDGDGTEEITDSGSDDADLEITEPLLTLVKTISPDSGLQAGDMVQVTLVLTNIGDGPAYEVALSDVLDSAVFDCASGTDTTADLEGFSATGFGTCSVGYTGSLAAGNEVTFTFEVDLAATVVTGSTYTNTANASGHSLDSGDPEYGDPAHDRTPSATDDDTLTVGTTSLDDKSITWTSEGSTTGTSVAVGEVVQYAIVYQFPSGLTRGVTIIDELPEGLSYIDGTATLARDDTGISAADNPGGINAAAAGTPVAVTLSETVEGVSLDLGDVTAGGSHAYTLGLRCVVNNVAGNIAGQDLADRGRIDWLNATGTSQTSTGDYLTVTVAEPAPAITKTADPTTGDGGDTIGFTIEICNSATGGDAATAFDWSFEDVLPAEYENPLLLGTDPGATGATITASFAGNTLSGTIDRLDPGECVEITCQADLVEDVGFADAVVNTTTFDTNSLPGAYGTGDETPGDPGDEDGERLYNGSDDATVNVDTPNIAKTVVNEQTWYAVADVVSYRLTVGVPAGTTGSFVITDVLPAGLTYVDPSQSVTPPAGFTSDAVAFDWDGDTRTLTWNFGTVDQAPPAGSLLIDYQAVVDNVIGNQDGTLLVNEAELTYGGGSAGPADDSISVGEPDLYLEKTPQTTPTGLDAGDSITFRVEFWNNGHTTAYQVDWSDVLPDGLHQISGASLTVVDADVRLNGDGAVLTAGDFSISTTTNTNDTIALPLFQMSPGSRLQVEFDCLLMETVVAGETLENSVTADYASQPAGDGDHGVRTAAGGGDDDTDDRLDNYRESAAYDFEVDSTISLVKTLPGGDDDFTIGEDFDFRLRTWIIEGITPEVEVHDMLPGGLTYQGHLFSTPAPGNPQFGNTGYDTRLGSGQDVWFSMGDVTNTSNQLDSDDYFDLDLTVRVDNIAGNQNGDQLTNSGTVVWGPDDTAIPSNDVEVNLTEPELAVSKTALPAEQSLGDQVTFTVLVQHDTGSTSEAFDLLVTDTLPDGLTFVSTTAADYTADGQNLEFRKASLTRGAPDNGSWSFSYTVSIDLDAAVGQALVNDLDVAWASLPGATGDPEDGRTGDGGVNDYSTGDDAAVTPTIDAFIDATKTVADLNGGQVLPGDTLLYTVTLVNQGDPVTSVVFSDPVPAVTTYVVASLTSSQGTTNDSGNPLVVDVGPMATGQTVTISFQVTVDGGTPEGTIIANQGVVDSERTVPEPTDEDGIDGNGDQPTTIPVGGEEEPAELYAWKFVEWITDADTSGDITPGDAMRYRVIFYNHGQTPLTNVSFSDTIPAGLTYAGASAWASSGSISVAGSTVSLSGMSIAVDGLESISFDVTVDQAGTFVNQGTADADQTDPLPSDGNGDPSDGYQPTVFEAVEDPGTGDPALDAEKRWLLHTDADGDGIVDPEDVIEFIISIENSGSAAAENVQFIDPIPLHTTIVPGSVSTSQGVVLGEDPVSVNLGPIDPGSSAVIALRVTVDGGTAEGTVLENQGAATADGGINEPTDDNGDDGDGKNPNLIPVGGDGTPENLAKTLHASSEAGSAGSELLLGEVATFRVSVEVPPGSTYYAELSDTLPAGLSYLAGSSRLARTFDTGLTSSNDPGGINGAAAETFVGLTDGTDIIISGQLLTLDLGHLINSDNDEGAEGYTLEFQALVDNTVGNQAGTVLTNSAGFDYRDGLGQEQSLPAAEVDVSVIEPSVDVEKTVDTSGMVPGGGTVQFTVTLTNPSGSDSAPAYDVRLLDTLPVDYVALAVDSITPGGGVSGVTDNSSGTTVEITVDSFPADGQLVVLYTATLAANHPVGTITNTADARWTSLPGTNGTGGVTPGDPGESDGERIGDLTGPNDHQDDDDAVVSISAIGDRVWFDTDMDGVQDGGESGVAGVTVNLYTGAGTPAGSTATTAGGAYLFNGLPMGDYFVEFILPANHVFSPRDQGGSDTADSDADTATGRTIATTLTAAEYDPNWDAGIYELASIGDRAWYDTDMDGIQDGGESGQAGVTVNLYTGAGTPAGSTTTAGDGSYGFDALEPGDYFVEFVLPANTIFSPQDQGGADTTDSDADTVTGRTATTTLSPSENDPSWDAGLFELASIGDRVWYDTDMDGVQDGGESGQAGVTVNLYTGTGTPAGSTTTAGDGSYGFEALEPGDYYVEFVLPANTIFSPQDQGGDNAADSDADTATGLTVATTLDPGENDLSWDAGLFELASIGDRVWYDTDMDGVQDGGEPGQAGVTVNLYTGAGTPAGSTTTAGDGSYGFEALEPGDYFIEVVLPANYIFTGQDQGGNDDVDSDVDSATGQTVATTLGPGENDLSWDAGLFELASIGDRVWYDTDMDGVQDGGEPGQAGVTVNLYTGAGTPAGSTTTAGDGSYGFETLEPGDYFIEVILPANYIFTDQDQGGDDAADSDVDSTTGQSATTTLAPGENDMTWDAGLFEMASLGDRVWYDADMNGLQDGGEAGVAGVTVNLFTAAGDPAGSTTTAGDGSYGFASLRPGDYFISFTLLPGYMFTLADQGGDDTLDSDADPDSGATAVTTLDPGENDLAWDAGMNEFSAIGDRVWYDTDMDGVQDAGETGVAGVTVNLYTGAGDPAGSTITAGDGSYGFIALVPGDYSVEFVLPANHIFSEADQGGDDAADSDADTATGETAVTTLDPGETDTTWDAGIFELASIGDRAWYDTDMDGVQDAGEAGIDGIIVNLYDDGGTPAGTTMTSGGGLYSFGSLVPGDYSLTFVLPANHIFSPRDQGGDDAADSDADTATGETALTTLGPGENDTTWDAGLFELASIGDRVWHDRNSNGRQDGWEQGVNGVTVSLFSGSGTPAGATETVNGGLYGFDGLVPGTYYVVFTAPGSSWFTARDQGGDDAVDSDADLSGATAPTILGPGENDPTWDAGLLTSAALGDQVWYDADLDGINDPEEEGVEGVTVNLLDENLNQVESTVTDGGGYYRFDDVVPGFYYVDIVLPADHWFSPVDQGGDDSIDSDADPDSGRTARIALPSSVTDLHWDAGIYQLPAAIGNRVWFDSDQDGIQDNGEPGIGGVGVELYGAKGELLESTTTDGSGIYGFDGLVPGDYYLRFVPPAGYAISPPDQGGDDAADSDIARATGLTEVTTLDPDENDVDWDAGMFTADFGDAPDPSFPTRLASNGAAHTIDGVTFLGAGVDHESNGAASPNATGDDFAGIDDEDGVTFTSPALVPGKEGTLEVIASAAGYLNIWIDFTLDGDWDDDGEWAVTDLPLTAGTHPLIIDVPADAVVGQTFLRFRFSTVDSATGGYTEAGPAPDGEVEDHVWQIYPTLALVSSFEAFELGGRTVVQWATDAEMGTAAFHLERLNSDGSTLRLTHQPLAGLLHAPRGGTYRVADPHAGYGDACRYLLIETEAGGQTRTHGPFTVTVGDARGRDSATALPAPGKPVADPRLAKRPPAGKRSDTAPAGGKHSTASRETTSGSEVCITVSEPGVHFVDAKPLALLLGMAPAEFTGLMLQGELSLTCNGRDVAWAPAPGMAAGIRFTAAAPDGIYSDELAYVLRPGTGLTMETVDGGNPPPAPYGQAFAETLHLEEDRFALTSLFTDPQADFWLWQRLVAGDPEQARATIAFTAPDPAATLEEALLRLHFKGASNQPADPDHRVRADLNGTTLGEGRWDGLDEFVLELPFSQALLAGGENRLEIAALPAGTGLDGDAGIVYLDSVEVIYQRRYHATNNRLRFTTGSNRVVSIGGFTSPAISVYDVSDPLRPLRVTNTRVDQVLGGHRVSFLPASGEAVYEAAARTAHRVPASLQAQDPTVLGQPGLGADYLIIAPAALSDTAETLAEHRRQQGWQAMTVTLEAIHQAFGHGQKTPEAVRTFLGHAWRHWQPAPHCVVLAGSGTYDYRDVLGHGGNLFPPLLTGTDHGLFASDSRFACVDGDDRLPEMAVGRLPVTDEAELAALIEKIIAYESSSGDWAARVLMVADDADSGGAFPADSDAVASQVPQGEFEVLKVYASTLDTEAAREQVISAINQGVGVVNYLGHAGMSRLAREGLLSSDDLPLLVNNDRLPLMLAMTCAAGRFGVPGDDRSLAEGLLLRQGGGAVAVWAPGGTSINNQVARLDVQIFAKLFQGRELLLGDLLFGAVWQTALSSDEPFDVSTYNLLGDPATRLK